MAVPRDPAQLAGLESLLRGTGPGRIEVPNPNSSSASHLEVRRNEAGDVDVEVHVPGRAGSPFTRHFPAVSDPEFPVAVMGFVRHFISGRLLLAYRSGWMRGGHEFVQTSADGVLPSGYAWFASWSGGHRLGAHERRLVDALEREVREASAFYRREERDDDRVVEPLLALIPDIPSHLELRVELTIGSDQLTITCNEAAAYLQSEGFASDEEWIEVCRRGVRYLATHDLELRLRVGALGNTGAIRLGPDEGDWAGDLLALRSGRPRVYSGWWTRIPAVALHDGRRLHPAAAFRVGERVFAEMREHPGEWWMGELDREGVLHVWGAYGSLDEAVRQH